jgi:DHA1 family multidrug resistance protein-like MFS transporter
VRTLRGNRNLATFLVAITLMEVAHGIEAMALLPLYLTEVLGSSVTLAGAVVSTYLIVDIATRTPAGLMVDRWGRKRVLLCGVVLSLIPLPLMMGQRDPLSFVVLNGLNGLGAGCIWPAIYASVADTCDRSQRGAIMGALNTVMLGGLALGPISGNFLLGLTSYPATFVVCIALVSIVLVVVQFAARETLLVRERPPVAQTRMDPLWLDRELVLLGVIALLLTISLAFLLPIISLYGSHVLLVDKLAMSLVLAVPAGITALLLVPAGHLADRIGRKPPIVAGLALLTLCFGAAPVTTNLLVIAAGATIAGLGYALSVPAWNALALDRMPVRSRGALLGGLATVQGAGLAIGPVVGGYLWEHVQYYAPFLAGAALLAIATALSLAMGSASPNANGRAPGESEGR